MIKTIILDIGQVLANFRWKEYLYECGYDEDTVMKISNATVLSKYWQEEDRGLLSQQEVMNLCCALDPSVEKEIKSFFENITETVREYDYSVDFIKQLKNNGYKVYLLSNYGEKNFKFALDHFKFIPLADGKVISYEVKHIKPEPEIYQALIQKYNINPKEAVFLDDSEINLEGARPFGFTTIQVKNFNQVLEDLRKLGVRI
ncbi:MAG: HAD-superfamily hydrolase subfamily variant 3 [Anaerocolumna sp.]|jgi:putative hydrolase of the HAD superfamily|nr:HAD-superfamily hydrolase subfamily variant 3 [Anaerocolumna sp.]